jgi:hypothetical protein
MKIAEFLRELSEGQVQYLLVGGMAVQLHGYIRSTFDIDGYKIFEYRESPRD